MPSWGGQVKEGGKGDEEAVVARAGGDDQSVQCEGKIPGGRAGTG